MINQEVKMITVVVPTDNTDKKIIPCTKCFKCKHPMLENKCGKFSQEASDVK